MHFVLLFLPIVVLLSSITALESKLDPSLIKYSKIAPEKLYNVVVEFKAGTSSILQSFTTQRATIEQKRLSIHSLTKSLKTYSHASQKSVQEYLTTLAVDFEGFWISNQICLYNVNSSIISKLAEYDEISRISEEPVFKLYDPILPLPHDQGIFAASFRDNDIPHEWNIQTIGADLGQAYLASLNTKEVRVGIIDTGVRPTHMALKDSYYGNYGWFDPYNGTTTPNDVNGHGTHVTGTICGRNGIGVYPGAKWMACMGCNVESCTLTALTKCGQFMMCPTLPNGTAEDCSKAPHVVNNSWGTSSAGLDLYDAVITAWHAAGIIPVFAIGNQGGNGCGSISSPGDRNVIGVGSVTRTGTISAFSSLGPSKDRGIKPEITAPGSNILSAAYFSDDEYISLQGTSMATPHVTGAIAMLLACYPNLTYSQVKQVLFDGANTTALLSNNMTCGGLSDSVFPNNVFGHGRLDVMESLNQLILHPPTTPSDESSNARGLLSCVNLFTVSLYLCLGVF
jgi:hypothetical protein